MSVSPALFKEQEDLKKRVDELMADISEIKKESNEGINFDRRMIDLLEMKKYLNNVKDNTELKKLYITSSKTKREKKGNYKMTLRRQKALTLRINDSEPMYNVIEIRKQVAIDSVARDIEKMSRTENLDDPAFINTIDKRIQSLAEQLDTDCKTNDVGDLLKTFDVNSVALRKTSTLFKVTSRLFSMEPIVEEETIADDAELERISICEKLTFTEITKKVADVAVSMEDAICLSAVMLGKPHDDYSGDFFDICSQIFVNVTNLAQNAVSLLQRLSELRADDVVKSSYTKELNGYFETLKLLIENEQESHITALLNQVENVEDIKSEFRPGDLEEIIRGTSEQVKSMITYLLMIAYALAHLKPKEIGKIREEEKGDKKKEKKKEDKKRKEFVMDRGFYREKMCLVELMSAVLTVYKLISIFSEQTRVILLLKQTPRETATTNSKAEIVVSKNHITSGNVNGFIERLTTQYEQSFAELFVTSFGSFMHSKELVEKLIDAYKTGNGATKDNVMKVFELLIYKSFGDLGKEAEASLLEFLKPLQDKKGIELKVQCERKSTIKDLNIAGLLIPPINFYIPDEPIFPTEFFISCEPKEIARQLTVIDHSLYKKVKPSELLESLPAVLKKNHICRYSHIVEMAERVDAIADWTATTILMFADMQNRIMMIQKFMDVASELEELNNFQSLAGICKGFENENVQRLGQTMKAVSSHMKHFSEISKTLGFNSSSYKGYKGTIEKIKEACVPFMFVVVSCISR